MTRALVLSATAAALLAPGCGGDDKPETAKDRYEREFKAVLDRFEGSPRIDPPDDAPVAEQIAAMEQARVRTIRFADALDGIDPPADIARAHADYVEGIRRYVVGEMDELVRALRSGGIPAAEAVVKPEPEDYPVLARIRAARIEFDEKGYDLGDISEVPQ